MVIGRDNLPSPVEIGLIDLPNIGGASGPPGSGITVSVMGRSKGYAKYYPFVDHDHDLECQTVSVELKNGASVSQGRKTGTYQRKEVFGKLPYWTSKNYAIWYNSKAKAWAIGTLASLGTNSQGILGIKGEFRWPFDKKYRWMYYKIGSGWMKTARNDITVKCKGK